ncbi:hypothetical protein [Bradyrhizobium sp.]|uniref:hypothetical protein n=1 Tax=Bradyrhizobium sp. TaxID=376 RepID=UPI00342932B6
MRFFRRFLRDGVRMAIYRLASAASCAALLLSGCAVGPNFASPSSPDVTRYTAKPLTSPHPNPERWAKVHRRGRHPDPLVDGVSLQTAQRPDQAVD